MGRVALRRRSTCASFMPRWTAHANSFFNRVWAGMSGICLAGALLVVAAVAAPASAAPVSISVAGQNATDPQVAVNADGSAVAVWCLFDGSHYIVQAATRPVGGSWSAPADLSAAGQNSLHPEVALNANGNAVAIWQRYDGSNYIIQAARRPTGGPWDAAASISVSGKNARESQVALDGAGNAFAVWQRSNGTVQVVQAATALAGDSWESPIDLSGTGSFGVEPQLALDGGGGAVALWRDSSSNKIQATDQQSVNQPWTAPVDLTAVGEIGQSARVALGGGVATAVWDGNDGSEWGVHAAGSTGLGAWTAALAITGEPFGETPEVGADAAGDAVAVWRHYDGVNYVIQAASKPAGGPWGTALNLTGPSEFGREPAIALDAAGGSAVAWVSYSGEAMAAGRSSTGTWTASAALSAAGEVADTPEVGIDGDGNGLVVWVDSASQAVEAAELGPAPSDPGPVDPPQDPEGSTPPASQPPAPLPPAPKKSSQAKKKSRAAREKQKLRKALRRCRKLKKGKARARCVKKARARSHGHGKRGNAR